MVAKRPALQKFTARSVTAQQSRRAAASASIAAVDVDVAVREIAGPDAGAALRCGRVAEPYGDR